MPRNTLKAQLQGNMLQSPLDFVQSWSEIQTLRQTLAVEDNVLTNPLHFLATTDSTRRSCSVACWRGAQLIGLVFATEHFIRGIGSGYAIAGDFAGRGAVLCHPQDESQVLLCASTTMTSNGIHALHLRLLPSDQRHLRLPALRMECMQALTPGDRMVLPETFDGFLATLGKHTRRNVRYYTRKAQAEGVEFASCLAKEEYDAAVARLNAASTFPAEPLRLTRDARLMALHAGCQRFGLRAPDGTLIAVLSGFSQGRRFHILTQLNDAHYERLSLSLILRGYTVQHLIQTHHDSLQFMGGTSLSFGRFCVPQLYRSIFIDKPHGLFALIKRMLASVVLHRERQGKPVPDALRLLANGLLPASHLIARTAIAPAAVAFARKNAPQIPSNPFAPVVAIRSKPPKEDLERTGIVQDRSASRKTDPMCHGNPVDANLSVGGLKGPGKVLNMPHRKPASA